MKTARGARKQADEVPLLSILAEPPPRSDGDPDYSADWHSVYINAVAEQIATSVATGRHTVKTAGTVYEVKCRIEDFHRASNCPFKLQVIGHGQSGHLDLGQSWRGHARYFDGVEYWRLATDPGIMNVLASARGKLASATLAACNVGSSAPEFDANDGTMLLFALQHLWDCPVTGAIHDINFSHFDKDTGVFTGPQRAWDGAAGDSSSLPAHYTYRRVEHPVVVFRELALADGSYRPVSYLLNRRLLSIYNFERRSRNDALPGPLLASEEFCFKIEASSAGCKIAGRATLSLRGRCLTLEFPDSLPPEYQDGFTRVGRSFHRYYFASNDSQDQKAAEALRLARTELTELSERRPGPGC